ncbi:MAG: hypothetical protein QXE78_01910 [Nitrososphaeria archaeon]
MGKVRFLSDKVTKSTKKLQEDHNVESTTAFLGAVSKAKSSLQESIRSFKSVLIQADNVGDTDIVELTLKILGSLYDLESSLYNSDIVELEFENFENKVSPTKKETKDSTEE